MNHQTNKPLDRHAATIGEHLRAKGYNITQIQKEFAKQGYITRNGTEYDVTSISKFLTANGSTVKRKYKTRTKRKLEARIARAVERGAKPLDERVLNSVILPMREQNKTIREIVAVLTEQGYTKLSGGEMCNATLSHFLIANGYRTQKRSNTGTRKYKQRAVETPTKVQVTRDTDDLDLATQILNSKTLSKTKKLQLLEALLE